MDFIPERRGSRNRALERSLSYSEAIGNSLDRSSIEIPSIVNSDVYMNEELKKHYRISQSYVEGKEITFSPTISNVNTNHTIESAGDTLFSESSIYSSGDENGLVMTIDVEANESPKSIELSDLSTKSTKVVASSSLPSDTYDRIDVAESFSHEHESTYRSTPYTRRKKKKTHRLRYGRPTRSRRVVFKTGEENVPVRSHIPSKSIKYMRDIVNTVINSKWRFIILMMVITHFMFWLLFASIWYGVARSYQDDIGDGKEHCVTGTSSFAGLLMMSVETQMTIGYGTRYPNEECPEAIFVMVLEIVAGTALSGGLSSLLFTKLVRPNRHMTSVGFSKKATVCLRDGDLCLQFRVWDLMNLHLIGSTITAYMLKPIRSLEGEMIQNYIHPLELKEARAFLLWPITVVHPIDHKSPLYDLSAQDMMDFRFEIVVCLTGSSKNMGTVTQSRTSYLSKEIIWGYRFKNVLKYSRKNESYIIDVDNLNTVEEVETPLCSASRLKDFEEGIKASTNFLSTPTNLTSNQDYSSTFFSSKVNDSVASSPSLYRGETQRSFGWNYRGFKADVHNKSEAK